MDKLLLKQSRQELEILLNKEVPITQNLRNDDIKSFQISNPELARENKPITAEDLEKTEAEIKGYGGLIYIRTTEPYFIAEGTHQAVLAVGNGLVAKVGMSNPTSITEAARKFASIESRLSSTERVWRSFSHFSDERDEIYDKAYQQKIKESIYLEIGLKTFQYFPETLGILEEYGLKVVPFLLYRLSWNGDKIIVSPDVFTSPYNTPHEIKEDNREKFPNIYLTPDLREGGKFQVVEYDENITKTVINGDELRTQFEDSFHKLLSFESNSKTGNGGIGPYFSFDDHIGDHTATGAIKRMFLLQVPMDKSEKGKLVVGDLDHAHVWR